MGAGMELAEARAAAQAELDSFSSPENPLRLVDDADVADVGWGWVWAWSTARWFETRDPAAAPPPGAGTVAEVNATGETFHLGSTPAFDLQLAEAANDLGREPPPPLGWWRGADPRRGRPVRCP